MGKIFSFLMVSALLALAPLHPAAAKAPEEHTLMQQQDMTWQPGPDSLPPGAQASVLYGDPATGPFIMRLKVPAGYAVPPHTHPVLEAVTVVSGALRVGMDASGSRDTAAPVAAGGFFAMPAAMPHYVYADENTVIELHSPGPWQIYYLNPADDPRQQQGVN